MESSLTAPSDKATCSGSTLNTSAPVLSTEETKACMQALNIKVPFTQVERRLVDPPIEFQKVALFSFVPSTGATPDTNGIYGMAKIRYVGASESEADIYAEKIIKEVDSFHQIFHAHVGRPFPVTLSSEFSSVVKRVDVKQAVTDTYAADVKKKREEDAKQIEEIKTREEELLKDVSHAEAPEDTYTTLKVKKAQLSWTYLETMKKIEQMRVLIAKCRRELYELEQKDENLAKGYYNKYIEAREKAGLRTDRQEVDTSFMRYLVEDVTIPEIDALYREMYESVQ